MVIRSSRIRPNFEAGIEWYLNGVEIRPIKQYSCEGFVKFVIRPSHQKSFVEALESEVFTHLILI
jgi:hypothetical protein